MADERDLDKDIANLEALLADIEKSLLDEGRLSEADLQAINAIRELCKKQKARSEELKGPAD